MLSFKKWLEKYGSEPCDGCFYNIPNRAKCTYKGTCERYDAYKESQRRLRTEKLLEKGKERPNFSRETLKQ